MEIGDLQMEEEPKPEENALAVQPVQVVQSSTPSSKKTKEPKSKKVIEPLTIEVGDVASSTIEERKSSSPKAETSQELKHKYCSEMSNENLKMTIKKQRLDEAGSILKICSPDSESRQLSPKTMSPRTLRSSKEKEMTVPKLIIKTGQSKESPTEAEPIPKLTIKRNASECQVSPKISKSGSQNSPKITIKPVVKPQEPLSPLKLSIKSVSDEIQPKSSPKLIIKPIVKPEEETVKATPKVRQINYPCLMY